MQHEEPGSAARRLLTLCAELGARYLFTNLGSDHPAFIEAFAALQEEGAATSTPMPQIIVCPHEMTALSAAHGFAMITRQPQVVLVHVDVGTQNLGCSIHNAARGRVPAVIVAGLSPVTVSGERTGSRNEFIHYTQDTPRQHEIVAQYMKWSYEVRAAEMIDGIVMRAVQLASSAPQGPVYLTGAREIWEAPSLLGNEQREQRRYWPVVSGPGLPAQDIALLSDALATAQRPIVITSYLGRQARAVQALAQLSERFAFGVCEVSPQYMNFPGTHAHHLSHSRNALVDEADLILMIDVDVPWIMSSVQPSPSARLFHIDEDALKQGLGFWHFPCERSWQGDSARVLEQLLEASSGRSIEGAAQRRGWLAQARSRLQHAATPPAAGAITPRELTEAVAELINERSIVIFEEPSSTELIPAVLKLERPGTYFASGGSGLGWGINAAIGARLARPDAEVIALVGDGCYVFGVPGSAYWVAGTYDAPFLTIIYNNGGWHSPKLSTSWVHPQGRASSSDSFWVTTGAGARLADLAAATGGAEAYRVEDRAQLKETLRQALQCVRNGRSAVVDVSITKISAQVL